MPAGDAIEYRAEVWDIVQFFFGKYNDHQLHCVINLKAHVDEDRLQKAVDLSTGAIPLIRCRFVEGPGHPYWQDGGFTGHDMVALVESESGDRKLARLLTLKTDELAGPQLKIYVVRGKDTDSLCIIMNHMICDAAGFKEYLYLLSSIYSHIEEAPGYRPDYKNAVRDTKQVYRRLSLVTKAKMLCDRYRVSKHSSGAIFPLEGDLSSPFIATHRIPDARFRLIKAYAGQRQSTVNDIMLTAYIRTLYKTLGRPVAVSCVVDLRKYLTEKRAAGICNLTSNLACDLGTEIGADFDGTLARVKQAMDSEKHGWACLNGIMLLDLIFGLLPYGKVKQWFDGMFINPPIAMTNIGIIDKSRLLFDNIDVAGAFMTGSIKYKPYFQLALTTFDDEVTFSINFHGTQHDKEVIRNFLLELDRELPA
jgi:NRPS condensation-like uncharacterized protein